MKTATRYTVLWANDPATLSDAVSRAVDIGGWKLHGPLVIAQELGGYEESVAPGPQRFYQALVK